MTKNSQATISTFSADDIEAHLDGLGRLLQACVHGGAGVHFVLPFTEKDAEAFWSEKVRPAVKDGARVLLVAQKEGRIAGSVQLDTDTPPNQPHRAEVSKLLVHPDFRRQGIARALIAALEQHAAAAGRNLMTLDTVTGDNAEPLYTSMGYKPVGVLPGYSLNPAGDRLVSTTIMYKLL